jgi:hypothetical protein
MCLFARPTAEQIRKTEDGKERVKLLEKASDRIVISLAFTAATKPDLINIAAQAEFEIRKAKRELRNSRTSMFGLVIAILAATAAGSNAFIQYLNYINTH